MCARARKHGLASPLAARPSRCWVACPPRRVLRAAAMPQPTRHFLGVQARRAALAPRRACAASADVASAPGCHRARCRAQGTRVAWLPSAAPGFAASEKLLALGGWAQDEAGGAGAHVVSLLSFTYAQPRPEDPPDAPLPPPELTLLRSWHHRGAVTDLHVRALRSAPAAARSRGRVLTRRRAPRRARRRPRWAPRPCCWPPRPTAR
jgi:hypothetical protein